jgi:predicted amidophosphoribosyltransferase
MALRVFTCENCGHQLRYGAQHCGKCWTQTPTKNHLWVPVVGAVCVLAALAAFGLLTRTLR